MNQLENIFTSPWGNLVESLAEGEITRILKEWGVEVTDTMQRRSGIRNGVKYEFNIIAINGTDIVIVEVKTTLRPSDIRSFVKKLKQAKNWMSEYSDKNVFGAVAFLTADAGVSSIAEKKGLFVIQVTEDSASIINSEVFVPKSW